MLITFPVASAAVCTISAADDIIASAAALAFASMEASLNEVAALLNEVKPPPSETIETVGFLLVQYCPSGRNCRCLSQLDGADTWRWRTLVISPQSVHTGSDSETDV